MTGAYLGRVFFAPTFEKILDKMKLTLAEARSSVQALECRGPA